MFSLPQATIDAMEDAAVAATIAAAKANARGGATWAVTRENASGVMASAGTLSPAYICEQQISRLERLLAGSAATLRAEWKGYTEATSPAIEANDVLTSSADATLAFRVTGVDSATRPGVTMLTLERQPFT